MTKRYGGNRRAGAAAGDRDPEPAAVPAIVTNTVAQTRSRRRFMGGAVSVAALASFAAAGPAARRSPRSPLTWKVGRSTLYRSPAGAEVTAAVTS